MRMSAYEADAEMQKPVLDVRLMLSDLAPLSVSLAFSGTQANWYQ